MWFIFITFICQLSLSYGQPVVDTIYGSVRGESVTLADGTVIDSYLGIPYATPPVGDLRFTLPQEQNPWDDILSATVLGDACMQPLINGILGFIPSWNRYSENCLHLNIYTPQTSEPDDLLPVMVWIHGGDYQAGSNFIYPGYFLAEKGVVVVTVNYRLGVFGFAYSGDGVIPGNMGLMDQILALQFVQDNIEAFGGDPNRVTIFGESAGAASVGNLIVSPLAAGLFHGAILESGCELSTWQMDRPEVEPENFIIQVAENLNCTTDSSEDMVECLRRVGDWNLQRQTFDCPPGYNYSCTGFHPVVDGILIPDIPENIRQSGNYNKVPEIIGINGDEANIFTPLLVDMDENGLNRSDFDDYIMTRSLYASVVWPDQSRANDIYEAFNFFYADWPYYDDPENNRAMLGKLTTDELYGHTSDRQAKLHSGDEIPVYYYVYDYVRDYSTLPDWMGAVHGAELANVIGLPYLYMEENEVAYNHSQFENFLDYSSNDKQYSDFIMTLWTNFAKHGNPTVDVVPGPNNTSVLWPLFNEGSLNYMSLNFKPTPIVIEDYRQKEYAFWNEYVKYLVYGEEFTSNMQGFIGFSAIPWISDIIFNI